MFKAVCEDTGVKFNALLFCTDISWLLFSIFLNQELQLTEKKTVSLYSPNTEHVIKYPTKKKERGKYQCSLKQRDLLKYKNRLGK